MSKYVMLECELNTEGVERGFELGFFGDLAKLQQSTETKVQMDKNSNLLSI